ncbi:SDR family oxidoreductase [Brevibacterium sp. 'Marine']|uniref:SDR family NAD(P)-dependent oxidoreductase n=1 Tax=Brevibacterium sp. 'Marine' TaxID=2725563 RepID=UPI00145D71F2|nr:SDR family oxidoreductase [Brevibacterium sp. 'Marine']
MTDRLAGKTAIISGGAGGCGLAATQRFAREGAAVGIIDLPGSRGAEVAEELSDEGFSAFFAPADVSDEQQVQTAVSNVAESLGSIDVLFNHAGTIVISPFLETSVNDWDRLMGINVRSMFLMSRAVIPHMLDAGGGSIVCTSSISAVAATPNEVLYNTTKGAVHMFARSLAVEFRDRGIRCNAVCPGFIETPHGQREVEELTRFGVDVSDEALAEQQGRMCTPEEVANAALFLASDEASFVNGTHLFVDNAYTAV